MYTNLDRVVNIGHVPEPPYRTPIIGITTHTEKRNRLLRSKEDTLSLQNQNANTRDALDSETQKSRYIYIYIAWVLPPPTNSDHQEYYICNRGFL